MTDRQLETILHTKIEESDGEGLGESEKERGDRERNRAIKDSGKESGNILEDSGEGEVWMMRKVRTEREVELKYSQEHRS